MQRERHPTSRVVDEKRCLSYEQGIIDWKKLAVSFWIAEVFISQLGPGRYSEMVFLRSQQEDWLGDRI